MNETLTSLEVGFPDGKLPEEFVVYRGRCSRSMSASEEFPFEDAQFDNVIMFGGVVSSASIKEAYRVLKHSGQLVFSVPEKTKKQSGYTLPEIYSIVRYGFDIFKVARTKWWHWWSRKRTLTIVARKKRWRELNNTFRPYL